MRIQLNSAETAICILQVPIVWYFAGSFLLAIACAVFTALLVGVKS